MGAQTQRIYTVDGMTCGHCRAAVLEEVGALGGVDDVDVDLDSGRMAVRGADLDDAAIAAAVVEAGYAIRP